MTAATIVGINPSTSRIAWVCRGEVEREGERTVRLLSSNAEDVPAARRGSRDDYHYRFVASRAFNHIRVVEGTEFYAHLVYGGRLGLGWPEGAPYVGLAPISGPVPVPGLEGFVLDSIQESVAEKAAAEDDQRYREERER